MMKELDGKIIDDGVAEEDQVETKKRNKKSKQTGDIKEAATKLKDDIERCIENTRKEHDKSYSLLSNQLQYQEMLFF